MIMFYKSLSEKRKQSVMIFNNNKRKGRKSNYVEDCQPINVEEIIELENHFLNLQFNYCFRQGLQMHCETSE